MRQRKLERCKKRQRGEFMTPKRLACDIVQALDLHGVGRILEPSCGNGSFVESVLGRMIQESEEDADRPWNGSGAHLIAVEIDSELLNECRALVKPLLEKLSRCSCDLVRGDFFRLFMERQLINPAGGSPNPLAEKFDLIIGNPPFGGSFLPEIEDELDTLLGSRNGFKIKKETYAFYIVACVELLRPGGRLVFICSDSLLTIPTMTGLRLYLMDNGNVKLHRLEEFSDETKYPMLVLEYTHQEDHGTVRCFGQHLCQSDVSATPNSSWGITSDLAKLFRGPQLGDFLVASSGMTTGKNEYFVREVLSGNRIEEPFQFRFYSAPVSVAYELARARLNKLPAKRVRELREAELRGDLERRVAVEPLATPATVSLPNEDYRPYNKANGSILYCPPTHVIYWKDEGDAVLTYKKTGNWYLRGVGGQPYFGREGLTWQLVASRFVPRYLPPGYILDSGAPCAFTRENVEHSELFFVIGWLLSPLANHILKKVINHTRNIQSKDFERMPYPWWVSESKKAEAIQRVVSLIHEAKAGRQWRRCDLEVNDLIALYEFDESCADLNLAGRRSAMKSQADRLTQPFLFR